MGSASAGIRTDSGQIVGVGELHAADVCTLHEQAVAAAWAGQDVVLDLTRVTGWSDVAQAMIIAVAQDLAERRSRLVLSGASLGLRMRSQRLDVFNRVRRLAV